MGRKAALLRGFQHFVLAVGRTPPMALLADAASQPKASSQEEEPSVTSALVRCDLSGTEQVEHALNTGYLHCAKGFVVCRAGEAGRKFGTHGNFPTFA